MTKRPIEEELNHSLERIRGSRLGDDETSEIASRVWGRLEDRMAESGAESGAELGTIHGCDDYQALIPAFVSGNLAPSRALLLEEHTRQCVPCRRALKAARSGDEVGAAPTTRRSRPAFPTRWAVAAVLAIAAIGTGYVMWSAGPQLPYGAVVESTGAGVYRAEPLAALAAGSEVEVGERLRVAPGESALLRLADGSLVEVRERSELAVESSRRGTTLRVERGSVIVEAAPQGRGRLYVSTDDCLVSVKGTIFAVSHGTKGSRVAVIEGEVQVDYAGQEQLLFAGDRAATWAAYGSAGSVDFDDLAWSDNVDRYLQLLSEVSDLRQALADELPRPGLRTSSRLLGLAPADMAFYAAFPNLTETLVAADRIVQERVAESPLLAELWSAREGAAEFRGHLDEMTDTLAEAGGYLGEEIVVTGGFDAEGAFNGPLVLAELVDAAGMRAFLDAQLAAHGEAADHLRYYGEGTPPAAEEGESDGMVVWMSDDTMVASPSWAAVGAAVGRIQSGPGAGTPGGLQESLAAAYRGGAEILVAADLERVANVSGAMSDESGRAMFEQTGILDARHLILQQRTVDGVTQNDAVLAFDGPRRGVAAWLAEPAPMGALRYVSPDAKLVAAAVVRQPVAIFDEMMEMARQAPRPESEDGEAVDPAAELERVEGEIGVDLRDDIAAALGGEVLMALDGPVVPSPAWKVVVEVYDPAKLTWAIGQLVAALNSKRAAEGLEPIGWSSEESGGRTFYQLGGEQPITMTFDDGYMVAAASRAYVDRALRFKESGYSIESSSRFTALMPADGRENFSALVYQDAMSLLQPLAERIADRELTAEQRAALENLRGQNEPTLAYAYGEESRIVFAARGAFDLLTSGLPGLMGLGAGFEGLAQLPAADTGGAG